LNLRPSGYEPDELPDCSTPQQKRNYDDSGGLLQALNRIKNKRETNRGTDAVAAAVIQVPPPLSIAG
jgi:hypothetical protein